MGWRHRHHHRRTSGSFTSAAVHAMLGHMTEQGAERVSAESPLERLARRGWVWLLGLGIVAIVIGVVVLVWPSQTLRVLGVLFGIYLLVSGAIEIVLAFVPGPVGPVRFLLVLTGALSILLGLISFRGALESILLLALWIGFSWLITGITRAVVAGSAPGLPYRGWQIFGGIVLAIGGVVIIVWPLDSVWALAVISGIWLIVIGVWQVVEALVLRSRGAEVLRALS
jgi:uncharacterized membrane protein HdeD (DUF308 family)